MILELIILCALVLIYGFVLGYNWKAIVNWKRPNKRKKIDAKAMPFDLNNPMNINAIENQIGR